MYTLFRFFLMITFLKTFMFAAATYTSGSNATQLATAIQGEGLTITNPVLRRGNSNQAGTFSNGIAGANLQVNQGIILTTMSVAESFTTNNSTQRTVDNPDTYTDADLRAIDTLARYDTIIFEFDVTLDSNTRLLLVDYQFASEEYHEYVGSRFNDAFGFFISGGDLNQTYNIARVVDSNVQITTENIQNYATVTVNNVNNGSVGQYNDATPEILTNSAYFIDNNQNNTHGTSPVIVEYDGLTKRLQAAIDNLTPGVTYHFKMAIADTGDSQLDTGVFVSKIIGVREPVFCYDYAYHQNKRYFTQNNDGTSQPYIQGTIIPNEDINVSLYIRNEETSDVLAKNITLDIQDINTTQAIYASESVFVINYGEILPNHISDSALTSTSNSDIVGIPINNLGDQQSAYAYYSLTPQNSLSDINISLNAYFNYTVTFDIGGGMTLNKSYRTKFGSNTLPMCSGDNTRYEPSWGSFNVDAKGIYTKANPKFNLPTHQVVRRAGEFLVTAHDANSTPVPYVDELKASTVVGVELIDAGKFHSTKASCDEPSSAISERVWIPFVDENGAKSQVEFTTALQNAIDEKTISITNIKDYFNEARKNTAFRIQVNELNDDNNTVIQYERLADGKYRMLNFPDLVKDYGTCKQPVRKFPYGHNNTSTTIQVAEACGNAGSTGVDFFTLSKCNECILGYNTVYICSRDNFATRPESFNIKLSDLNQTNKIQKVRFADDRTGIVTTGEPNSAPVHIATGYSYGFDINATTHDDNNNSSGYTAFFTTSSTNDRNISFNWNPSIPNPSLCNDTTSKPLTFSMVNGTVSSEANISNVGEYLLGMIDTEWTVVDNNLSRMSHHKSVKINGTTYNVSNYFVGSGNALDCLSSSAVVQNTSTLPSISGSSLTRINGCWISSEHNNTDENLKYRDYNITAHPYHFLMPIIPSHGMSEDTNFTDAWVYMNDLNDTNDLTKIADINESIHFRGDIIAAGHDNTTMTNFVKGCYAKDVNLTLDHNFSRVPPVEYNYRLFDLNNSNEVISIVPPQTESPGLASAIEILDDGNFTKDLIGAARINLNLNFDRNLSLPINPIIVTYKSLDVQCKNDADNNCTMQADLKSNHTTEGNLTMEDTNLTHYYGRVYSTDYREESPIVTTIRYEVYCDQNCNPDDFNITRVQSPTSLRWYQNTLHVNDDGNVTTNGFTSVGTTLINYANAATSGNIVNGLEGNTLSLANGTPAPYTDRIQMRPFSWLLHNLYNPNAITNDFNVEFIRSGNWVGKGTLRQTVDLNLSKQTQSEYER